jgi:hypothetical protein
MPGSRIFVMAQTLRNGYELLKRGRCIPMMRLKGLQALWPAVFG